MGLRKTPSPTLHLSFRSSLRQKHARIEKHDELLQFAPMKKRVRFASESGGSVNTAERSSDIVHSDLDKTKLWWTRQERTDILGECQDAINDFRADHMDQVHHYLGIFDKCCNSLLQSSSDYLEKASVVLPANVRGLEWGIAPSTKNHRRVHVQDILEVQDRVQNLSTEMRQRLLSARSLRSSRRCLLMARLLGEGDKVDCSEGRKRKRPEHDRPPKARS